MRLWFSGSVAAFALVFSFAASGCSAGSGGGLSLPSGPTGAGGPPPPTPVPPVVAVASVAITLGTANPPTGTAIVIPVTLAIKNAAGAIVTGSGTFQQPLTLTNSDTSGHTTLSTTTLTNASTAVTLRYDGSRLVTSVTIGASVPGVPPANITSATLTPLSTPAGYSGTTTETHAFAYPIGSPLPSTSVSGTLALAISNGNLANPSGAAATDIHSVETETLPLFTSTETTDTWLGFSPTQTTVLGSVSADGTSPTPNTIMTAYTVPQIVDQLPETNGSTWTNSPQGTVLESDAGFTASRVVNADGTYTETDTYPGRSPYAYTNVITVNADGSGSYTGSGWVHFGIDGFTYSAPVNGVITINLLGQNGPAVFATVNAWYPTSPARFFTQTNVVTTGATFPASCAVPASYGSVGNRVAQSTSRIDPIVGYSDGQTIDTYTAADAGTVCVVMNDTTDFYYDYSGDQGYARFGFGATPKQVVTFAQTLTINSGQPYGILSGKRKTSSKVPLAISRGTVIAGVARFTARAQRAQAKQKQAFHSYIERQLQNRMHQGVLR